MGMELPDDVLCIVRAFSKPRMRFYKEYRQGLTELGFSKHEHWPELRDKLCSSEAELVFTAFMVYKEATLSLRYFKNSPIPRGPQLYYIQYHEHMNDLQLTWKKLDRALRVLLAGETRVLTCLNESVSLIKIDSI